MGLRKRLKDMREKYDQDTAAKARPGESEEERAARRKREESEADDLANQVNLL